MKEREREREEDRETGKANELNRLNVILHVHIGLSQPCFEMISTLPGKTTTDIFLNCKTAPVEFSN